jgi:hypothetical protein
MFDQRVFAEIFLECENTARDVVKLSNNFFILCEAKDDQEQI